MPGERVAMRQAREIIHLNRCGGLKVSGLRDGRS